MVLFSNVYIGQKVEVFWGRGVFRGTVQYKGSLATKRGDWVGVALDTPGESLVLSLLLSLLLLHYFWSRPNNQSDYPAIIICPLFSIHLQVQIPF